MNFQVLANPLFFALFIFLKPSAMSDMAGHEALLNVLQNPTIPTHSNHWFWSLPGFTLWWARPCAFFGARAKMDAISSPRPRLWPRHESCITFPSPTLSHWLHPAHFNLIFLPHVPRPSVGESVQLLLSLKLVWKRGTFPKDQNKQGGKIRKQKEAKLNRSPLHTMGD